MADIVDKATRSRMMAGIRGKNTKPELHIRRALHRLGFRYRLHARDIPGKPDLVLRHHRAVILVHGCFWHRHTGCRYATTPATNASFWALKFQANVERDQRDLAALRAADWRVGIVWECAVRSDGAEAVADQLAQWLRSNDPLTEIPIPEAAREEGVSAGTGARS